MKITLSFPPLIPEPPDDIEYRTEQDSMGEVQVPVDAMYGPSTQRAVENFPISGIPIPRQLIHALASIKEAYAVAAGKLGLLDTTLTDAIKQAAAEVAKGDWDEHFPVDIFQTGSGTSSNINANEVIARRANQILAEQGSELEVHPNDHVNFGQSSNDVFPSAIHLAVSLHILNYLNSCLEELEETLGEKSTEFSDLVKSGRTHLMDATPLTLGQEFSGYQAAIKKARERLDRVALGDLPKLPLGGTAVGTGVNCPPGLVGYARQHLEWSFGYIPQGPKNHFEAQANKEALVHTSGLLKNLAVSLFKIANDLRWLASGPVTGLAEINLPALQPGSSIMPAKVNPVIPEAVMMVCAQVIGNDTTVAWAGANGNFELNVMMPVMAHNLLESVQFLGRAAVVLSRKCVEGITANRERITELLEKNVIVVTALNPYIGYDRAAAVAKEAFSRGVTVRQVVLEQNLMSETDLDQALDLKNLVE